MVPPHDPEIEVEAMTWLVRVLPHDPEIGVGAMAGLARALSRPDPPPLLVIEKVENGLDPRTIHVLVEEFRAAIAAKKTQIIGTAKVTDRAF